MFGEQKAVDGTGVEGAIDDKKDQYDQIVPWMLAGEKLHVVFDCKGGGTGFVAVTDKRLNVTTRRSSGSARPSPASRTTR